MVALGLIADVVDESNKSAIEHNRENSVYVIFVASDPRLVMQRRMNSLSQLFQSSEGYLYARTIFPNYTTISNG